jgi:hypothetical protein
MCDNMSFHISYHNSIQQLRVGAGLGSIIERATSRRQFGGATGQGMSPLLTDLSVFIFVTVTIGTGCTSVWLNIRYGDSVLGFQNLWDDIRPLLLLRIDSPAYSLVPLHSAE